MLEMSVMEWVLLTFSFSWELILRIINPHHHRIRHHRLNLLLHCLHRLKTLVIQVVSCHHDQICQEPRVEGVYFYDLKYVYHTNYLYPAYWVTGLSVKSISWRFYSLANGFIESSFVMLFSFKIIWPRVLYLASFASSESPSLN